MLEIKEFREQKNTCFVKRIDHVLIMLISIEIFLFIFPPASLIKTKTTCYGWECASGEYNSTNYPNGYPVNQNHLYLIYIPATSQIHFEVLDLDLETGKDVLNLGPGLIVPDDGDMEQFTVDGPGNYTFEGDAAWINFFSDRSKAYRGFRLRWVSDQGMSKRNTIHFQYFARNEVFCYSTATVFTTLFCIIW